MQVLEVWRMIDPEDGGKGHAIAVFFTNMAGEGLSRAFPVRPKKLPAARCREIHSNTLKICRIYRQLRRFLANKSEFPCKQGNLPLLRFGCFHLK
jgi:hypothetical protein